ncbi:hypothetical protein EV196_106254 [Mariniflexile fucanivorans]|uniref:Uncharacterized protein n=1 Tax=Mariniflexile fucanivorans TaxID=264023 RepID=A0A4R1RHJ8_9FLAO|nr:hypothetical protein [Mariniflexile fucanivorans]TCL65062.1 hypothetical protein EV196_106254 [Mariniflexile fucanivorans]
MRFEEYINLSEFSHKKIQLSFGKFFICDHFVVAELNHEIHVDWSIIQKIANMIIEQYGYSKKIGFISNKVNSYSIDPYVWVTFSKEYDFIEAAAIVWYNDAGFMSATLEKMFLKNSVKLCETLDEAVLYILNS